MADLRGYSVDRLWLRGGFPASYLARNDDVSLRWRQDFVRTFLAMGDRMRAIAAVAIPDEIVPIR